MTIELDPFPSGVAGSSLSSDRLESVSFPSVWMISRTTLHGGIVIFYNIISIYAHSSSRVGAIVIYATEGHLFGFGFITHLYEASVPSEMLRNLL